MSEVGSRIGTAQCDVMDDECVFRELAVEEVPVVCKNYMSVFIKETSTILSGLEVVYGVGINTVRRQVDITDSVGVGEERWIS